MLVMKFRLLLVVLFLFGVGACTQKTCPAYTKDSQAEKERQEVRV